MALMDMIEAAQGGGFFAAAARAAGSSESTAKSAMAVLCPMLARDLKERAREPQAYQRLLDLLDEGQAQAFLDDPALIADKEAIADGHAVLIDLYGSRQAALKKAEAAVSGLDAAQLDRLAAISATAVLAALARQAQGVLRAFDAPTAGGGFWGTILAALLAGALKGAVGSLARRQLRPSRPARSRKPGRQPRQPRQRTPSLEDIFGDLLGTRR